MNDPQNHKASSHPPQRISENHKSGLLLHLHTVAIDSVQQAFRNSCQMHPLDQLDGHVRYLKGRSLSVLILTITYIQSNN